MFRQEAHAGDQFDRGENVVGHQLDHFRRRRLLDGKSSPPAAMPAEKQIVNFFSFMDNYNGLSNLAQSSQPECLG